MSGLDCPINKKARESGKWKVEGKSEARGRQRSDGRGKPGVKGAVLHAVTHGGLRKNVMRRDLPDISTTPGVNHAGLMRAAGGPAAREERALEEEVEGVG